MSANDVVHGRLVDGYDAIEMLTSPDGAFYYLADNAGLCFMCPCGCGSLGVLPFHQIGTGQFAIWTWDGNREAPTLSPSIRRTRGCKWHGFLKAGVWEPCGDSGS